MRIFNIKSLKDSIFIAFWPCFVLLSLSGGLQASQNVTYKGPKAEGKALGSGENGAAVVKEASERGKGHVYDPRGKTDPFKPFMMIQEVFEEDKSARPKTYLETLDLSQLELIAIILNPKGNWAMVRDAKGVGHVIRSGTPIGTNNGVVHQIKDGEVIVREKYKDFRGQAIVKDIPKKLLTVE